MSNGWNLPDSGIFQFDFVSFADVPTSEEELSADEFLTLMGWFRQTLKSLSSASTLDANKEVIGNILSECFRGCSEIFVFSTEQLL
jgi:hypothetical protein